MHNATDIMAVPEVARSNMSPKAVATLLIGAEANIQPKKLERSTSRIFACCSAGTEQFKDENCRQHSHALTVDPVDQRPYHWIKCLSRGL